MFNYLPIKQTVPTSTPESKDLFTKSLFLSHAFLIKRDQIVGKIESNLKRRKELDIWIDVGPVDGELEFEVAVQLPFFLPTYREADEYEIKLQSASYIICNRCCEVMLEGHKEEYFLMHYFAQSDLARKHGKKINQLVMTRSVIIRSFTVSAETASMAIEDNFEEWLNTLNKDIRLIIDGLRYHLDDDSQELPDCNNIGRFCPIYIVCKGDKISSALKFAAHVRAAQIMSFSKFSCDLAEIEAFCNGTKAIDTSKLILGKADLLYRSGDIMGACILACIGCETSLQTFILYQLKQKGLSGTKEKDAFNNLSFSQMLNFVSYFVLDMKNSDTKHIIGKLNALRKLRNDVIHEGRRIIEDPEETVKLGIKAVKDLQELILTQNSSSAGT